jgi:hypothetical protein
MKKSNENVLPSPRCKQVYCLRAAETYRALRVEVDSDTFVELCKQSRSFRSTCRTLRATCSLYVSPVYCLRVYDFDFSILNMLVS